MRPLSSYFVVIRAIPSEESVRLLSIPKKVFSVHFPFHHDTVLSDAHKEGKLMLLVALESPSRKSPFLFRICHT